MVRKMATEYGLRLKAARKHAEMTQVQASNATGIPQSTISTAEREGYGSGDTPIYAKVYNVDAHWLATGEGLMLANKDDTSDRLKAALATVAGLLRTIPEDQWGNALMDIAEVLQRGRNL